jgi:hypothetical protein
MSVGTEEANRLVVAALAQFLGKKALNAIRQPVRFRHALPIFNRLALIGMGLIGSSIARAAARKALRVLLSRPPVRPRRRRRVAELGLRRSSRRNQCRGSGGRRVVIVGGFRSARARRWRRKSPRS